MKQQLTRAELVNHPDQSFVTDRKVRWTKAVL